MSIVSAITRIADAVTGRDTRARHERVSALLRRYLWRTLPGGDPDRLDYTGGAYFGQDMLTSGCVIRAPDGGCVWLVRGVPGLRWATTQDAARAATERAVEACLLGRRAPRRGVRRLRMQCLNSMRDLSSAEWQMAVAGDRLEYVLAGEVLGSVSFERGWFIADVAARKGRYVHRWDAMTHVVDTLAMGG